jgi:hypothetical protein
MNGKIVLRVLLALGLIAGAVGIAIYAYNVGIAQGLIESGKLAAPTTGVAPYPFYGGPFFFHWPFGFGLGLLGCLFPLLFFVLFFGLLRGMIGRGHWGKHRAHWEKGVPPMFEEWHRKMHEPQAQ